MDGTTFMIIYLSIILLLVLFFILKGIIEYKEKLKLMEAIEELADNSLEVSPEKLLEMKQATLKGKKKVSQKLTDDFVGVYIIYNKTKDMYYVGQAKKVLARASQHFTGHGNGDVYADYKYGDEFTIKTISLNTSGYSSLDRLEKDTIETYEAFSSGYNKTRGNS